MSGKPGAWSPTKPANPAIQEIADKVRTIYLYLVKKKSFRNALSMSNTQA